MNSRPFDACSTRPRRKKELEQITTTECGSDHLPGLDFQMILDGRWHSPHILFLKRMYARMHMRIYIHVGCMHASVGMPVRVCKYAISTCLTRSPPSLLHFLAGKNSLFTFVSPVSPPDLASRQVCMRFAILFLMCVASLDPCLRGASSPP